MTGPVALFFGTRPQVIKASVLRDAFVSVGSVAAVDTGQHYDYALHQVHYDQLGVRPPDAYLGVGSGTHGRQTAALLVACEDWITAHRPRAAVVIGDTNSTLACALAATKLRVPLAHVEAGLYAADRLMAEEINRRAVDSLAELLFAPCERVGSRLRARHPESTVAVTGDVSYDVLCRALERLPAAEKVRGYDASWGRDFVLVTLHRAELVDAPERLRVVMESLNQLSLPCLFVVHPRTTAALQNLGFRNNGRLKLTPPVGYLENLALLRRASAVVTDSGGIQREAYWLGIPCVTVRDETEWIETLECGANQLVRPERAQDLPTTIDEVLGRRQEGKDWERTAYGDGYAAKSIAALIAERF